MRNIYILFLYCSLFIISGCEQSEAKHQHTDGKEKTLLIKPPPDKKKANDYGDTANYNKLLLHLVHNTPNAKWPVVTPRPLPGAILPYKRVVAYYGNFYSKGMGILGELPVNDMLNKLMQEVRVWENADSMIPVLPAIHYIAVTAQGNPGKDGKYRLRMPAQQIDKALEAAKTINAILILDVQVGHSSVEEELPALEKYLRLPGVHLGIDPEYSMKGGERPCAVIGTFNAADINFASAYLAGLVIQYHLPPKILVIHRFTKDMITGYKNIIKRPEVQIVVDMDGFGFPAKKISSYNIAVKNEPIQFAGFKLFYKNDKLSAPYRLMTPKEILDLYPSPIYIQYQ